MKKIKLSDKTIAFLIIGLYAVLYIFVSCFHEPWFDEAQAWEIARDGSLHDILFLITHGEGHPPLWSLILAIPAKLGVPYLWGLKSVAFLFSVATVCLIEFFAPFPGYVKHMLPFTYFIFYQYGVISRTYCVLMLVLLLAAIAFKDKDKHPFRFVGTLFLLCLCTAYGIAVAGGIAIAWCIDILKEYKKSSEKFSLIKVVKSDSRVWALALLLLSAVGVILQIRPYSSTMATSLDRTYAMLFRAFYMLFAMPGDSVVSSTFPENMGMINPLEVIPGLIVTAIIVGYMFVSCRKNSIKFYILPQAMYAVLMTYYGIYHHSGIAFLIIVFAFWIGRDEEVRKKNVEKIAEKIPQLKLEKISKGMSIAVGAALGIMVFYSALSAVAEVRKPFSESLEVARFIKEHNMENASIMVEWDMKKDIKYGVARQEDYEPKIEDYDTNSTLAAVAILPYFDKNIFFNHNINNGAVGYTTHFVASDEENAEAYEKWREQGHPEVLLDNPRLEFVYDDISYEDYQLVLRTTCYQIWKGGVGPAYTEIYVRKDCLEKYGFN